MLDFKLIDGIIKEPLGGAHNSPEEMAKTLKKHLKKEVAELMEMTPDERISLRVEKYSRMGQYDTLKKKVAVKSK